MPPISLINAIAFQQAYKAKRSIVFQLSPDISATHIWTPQVLEKNLNLSNISNKYLEFADVFYKQKSKSLSEHCFYDLTIPVEKRVTPHLGPIYVMNMRWDYQYY